jgi:hypothetical protein
MTMDENANPFTDSFSSGLGEAWDSLGDAAHNAKNMVNDAGQIAYHTAASMGDAFLGDTESVDHHMSERHGYERELSSDYNMVRRDLGLSAPEIPEPTLGGSDDSSGGDSADTAPSDDSMIDNSAPDTMDDQGYTGGGDGDGGEGDGGDGE